MSQSPLITIVDDDTSIREAIEGLLKASGFVTEAFPSAEAFLGSERLNDTACLITDLQLGGMSGLQLMRHLAVLGYTVPVIVITAFAEDGRRALAGGALRVLEKPVVKDELLACIRSALQSGGHAP